MWWRPLADVVRPEFLAHVLPRNVALVMRVRGAAEKAAGTLARAQAPSAASLAAAPRGRPAQIQVPWSL